MFQSCPKCNKSHQLKSSNSYAYVCDECFTIIGLKKNIGSSEFKTSPVPEDMTPIRLGTTGTWENKKFEIIGRIRYQYKEGYANHWAILFADDNFCWLGESFGAYFFFRQEFFPIDTAALMRLKASKGIRPANKKPYWIDAISHNCSFACEGELPIFPDFPADFFTLDGSNSNNEVIFINVTKKKDTIVFTGHLCDFDQLQFSKLRNFNEWI